MARRAEDFLDEQAPAPRRSASEFLDAESFLDERPSTPSTRAPDDSWTTLGRKLLSNAGAMFRQAGGSIVSSLASADLTPPTGVLPDDPMWQSAIAERRSLLEQARTAGKIPGQRVYEEATAELAANAPNVEGSLTKQYAYDIAQGIIQMAPALAASLATKSPVPGITILGAQVYGPRYEESRAAGRSHEQSTADATFNAAAEAIPEAIPLGILIKPGGKFLMRTLKAAGAEGIQEVMTEALQAGYDKGVLHPEMPWSEVPGRLVRAGIVGAGVGGGLAAVSQPFVRSEPQQRQERPEGGTATRTEVEAEAQRRLAELNARPNLSRAERAERDFYRANPSTEALAEALSVRIAPELTPADRASPIPDDLILEGKTIVEEALSGEIPTLDDVVESAPDTGLRRPGERLGPDEVIPPTAPLDEQPVPSAAVAPLRATAEQFLDQEVSRETQAEAETQAQEEVAAGRALEPAPDPLLEPADVRPIRDERIEGAEARPLEVAPEPERGAAPTPMVAESFLDAAAEAPEAGVPGGVSVADQAADAERALGESDQFRSYRDWIEQQTPRKLSESRGMLEQIRMDERLEDGEGATLYDLWNDRQMGPRKPGELDQLIGLPTTAEPPAAAPLRIEPYKDNSIIVRGQTRENIDRIKGAVPGVRALWNKKAGGWVFAKKREAEVREALADLLDAAPAPQEAPSTAAEAAPKPVTGWDALSEEDRRAALRPTVLRDQTDKLVSMRWDDLSPNDRRTIARGIEDSERTRKLAAQMLEPDAAEPTTEAKPVTPQLPPPEGIEVGLPSFVTEQYRAPKADEQPAEQAEPTAASADTREVVQVSAAVARDLGHGRAYESITDARRSASAILGREVKAGTPDAKMVDEAVELGATMRAREIVIEGGTPRAIYDKLVDLYGRMPKLGTRTSTSVAEQAYSTPLPLAYLSAHLADIKSDSTVYEPTAGNGALLITSVQAADDGLVRANELNAKRAANLRATMPGLKVSTNDATEWRPREDFDVIIGNPPFGVVKDNDGETIRFQVDEEYDTGEIDHAIAMKALSAMKDDGSAVLIVGSVNKLARTEEARSDAYNSKAKREFYLKLYGQYNVVDHFTVPGELYETQGAGWPVDVIVIRGRGKSAKPVPAVEPPKVFDSWEALAEKLDARYERPEATVQRPVPSSARVEPGSESRDERDRGGSREGRPPVERESPAPVESAGVRDGRVDRQPDSGRSDRPALGVDAEAATRQDTERRPRRLAVAATESGDTPRQVPYKPAATNAPAMGTLVPVNMQSATDDALESLKARVGDIEKYVADRLDYKPQELGEYFGAEQIDALALGINNLERGAGFIIGDQTGIGKGRVVAAILRYAILSKRTPIFVTEKPNLYGDMYRDLTDIGIQKMLGRDVSILMTDAAKVVPLDEEGKRLKTGSATEHNALLTKIAGEGTLGDEYDMVFTTYSQMQTLKGDATPRMRFLETLANGGIVIFDESHNAGGTKVQEGKGKKPVLTRSVFARKLGQIAHGVFYSSATYAKRPDVMDLYASTDMRLAVADVSKLAESIQKGGVPMQQVVASMLAGAGQYVRRERSFDGIVYNTPVVKVSRETYANYSRVLARIQDFSETYVPAAVKAADKALKAEGKSISHDGSTGGAGASSTNFTSVMHNLIDQMLLSISADAAADRAIEALKKNEKPVITVANTMGSFLDDYVEGQSVNPGDKIAIDFNSLLLRYLERTRWITLKKPFQKGPGERKRIDDEALGPQGVAAFNAAEEFIRSLDFSAMPVSPIDHIRMRLAKAGYKVGEITGRNKVLDYRKGGPFYEVRKERERSIRGRRETIAGFNGGKLDALIINQAGSTGISLHASEKFKDKRKRRMILAQAEKNIDTHMQMLGRVNRTGQVVLPEYDQLVADVPAVKRPAAVLSKKMASLNANTTAARGHALKAENVPDFINEYGDRIALRLMVDNPEIHMALGEPLGEIDDSDGSLDYIDAARKVTGRIPLLPIEDQERIYEQLESEYADFVAQKEAAGESILEAKTLPLDARVKSRTQVIAPQGGSSPFADGVYVEEVDVKRLRKPHTADEVLSMVAAELGIDRATLSVDNMEPAIESGRRAQQALFNETMTRAQAYRQEVIDEIASPESRASAIARMDGQVSRFKDLMRVTPVGASVRIQAPNAVYYGVVIKVEQRGQPKNPLALGSWRVTVATADATKQITFPMSQLDTAQAVGDSSITRAAIAPSKNIMDDMTVIRAFDELQTESREPRTMITGNLLSGFEHVGGKGAIINFTDADGGVRQGVLMPRGFNYEKTRKDLPVPLRTTEQVLAMLRRTSAEEVQSTDRAVVLKLGNVGLRIEVAAAKSVGGQYYLNKAVLAAVGHDFVSVGPRMRADVTYEQASAVVEALQRAGASFQATTNLKEARDIAGGVELAEAVPRGWESAEGREAVDVPALRAAVRKLFAGAKNAPEVTFVAGPMPPELVGFANKSPGMTWAGAFNRSTGRVYINTEVVRDPDEAVWVAAHEIAGHLGLQGFIANGVDASANKQAQLALRNALGDAARNAFVDGLSVAIRDQRSSLTRAQSIEEALAELAAAIRTDNFERIYSRYGLEVPAALRGKRKAESKNAIMRVIDAFIERLEAIINRFAGYRFSDEQVRGLLEGAWRYVREGETREQMEASGVALAEAPDTAAFRRWFGDSRVVDENGKPLVVYHGTATDFAAFKMPDDAVGAWFSASQDTASRYAGIKGRWQDDRGDVVIPAYLSIKNPASYDHMDEVQNKARRKGKPKSWVREQLQAEGYDGVAVDGGDSWIAFEPTQIKSAIGNRGTFDSSDPSIVLSEAPSRFRFDPERARRALAAERATAPPANDVQSNRFLDEAVFRFQDKFNYLYKAQKAAAREQGLAEVPEEEDAYLAELRYHGMAGAAIEDFQRDHVEPLVEAISKSGLTIDDVDTYLHARHAPEANARLKEINPEREDNDALSGMSDEEAEQVTDRFRTEGKIGALERIATRVDAINQAQRELLVAAGLEKADTVQTWEDTYQFYVPLHREGFEAAPGRGAGFSVAGRQKRRAGSTRAVEHILAHVVAQQEATIVRAEKNKVARALLEFAKNNPNSDLYEVDKVEYKPSFDEDGLVTYRPQRGTKYADNVIVAKVDGKDYTITFNTRNHQAARIAHAMKNLGADHSGAIVNTLHRLTRWLAIVNTGANPEFIVSNFARDLQTAGYNLSSTEADKLKWKIIKDVGKAWRGIRRFQKGKPHVWAEHFDAFRKAGAQTGWMDHYRDIAQREKRLVKMIEEMRGSSSLLKIKKGLRAVEQFIEHENTAVENAIRLSAFVHARNAGMSEGKAAQLAKELTVNFNKKGDYGQVMNAFYLFYNASIQGSARIIAAGAKSRKVRLLMGATVVAAMFLDMLNRALGGDDEDGKARYDKIPEYVKERNLVIMLSESKDAITIPLPWGYNVFHVLGQVMGEALTKRNFKPTEGAMRVAAAVFNAFNPIGGQASTLQMVSPTITDPLVQWSDNEDWAGRQIRPESNPFDVETPASQQYWNSVREPSRWVTEKLNELTGGNEIRPGVIDINPEAIDLMIDTFTGGAGRFVSDTLSTPIKAIKGEDVESYEVPLLRRLYRRSGQGDVYEEYYRNADAVRITEKEARHYAETEDRGALNELKLERPGEYALIEARRNVESELRKLRQARNRVDKSALSDADKRARRDEIGEKIEQLMVRFNKIFNERVEE